MEQEVITGPVRTGVGQPIQLAFGHGLGDHVHFAHVLAIYASRGYTFEISTSEDKQILFAPVEGVEVGSSQAAPHVPWHDGRWIEERFLKACWLYNKIAQAISAPPLPMIGEPEELWDELGRVRLEIAPYIPRADRTTVRRYLRELPRPVILIHTDGNSDHAGKSMPHDVALETYMGLLDRTDGSLILLDWDDRVPRLASYRVRHLTDDLHRFTTAEFFALLLESDLILGVDSGPLHAARYTDIPAVGYFPNDWHHPARFCLPRARQVNIASETSRAINRATRSAFNIVECPGAHITSRFIVDTCVRMLTAARYLDDSNLGADAQLQQFVLEWERGRPNRFTQYTDRHRGFDVLLLTMRERFRDPVVVETGCIRQAKDWRGAGYATFLLGAFLRNFGGRLTSVDVDSRHCDFARAVTQPLGCVHIVHQDSVRYLAEAGGDIDVLLLDSVDTEDPGAADHALREAQAAMPRLHERSIIVFDDTVYSRRRYLGKGSKAVPWLLDQGWRVLYSGYQTILVNTQFEAVG